MKASPKRLWITYSMLFAVLTMVFISSGCSNSNKAGKETESPAPVNSASTEPVDTNSFKFPVDPGSVTLRVGVQDSYYAPASLAKNLPVFQEIEKKTGVKIEWEVTPPAQFAQAIKLKLASGSGYGDVIQAPSVEDMVKYGSEGIFIPLEGLIEKYAPNIKKLMDEDPNIAINHKSPDGHIYGISTLNYSPQQTTWLLRQDWLDKLNLKAPETAEDWLKVLRAFKTQDPNGNNKQDEIPLSIAGNDVTGGINTLAYFSNVFGLHLPGEWWADESGKVSYEWIDDKVKDWLAFAKTLYEEKLLDQEFVVNTSDRETANINNNLVGTVLKHAGNIPIMQSAMKQAGVSSPKWTATIPAKTQSGEQFIVGYPLTSTYVAISKENKHPEITMMWLDYLLGTTEGRRYMTLGIEGESYVVEDDKIKFTDAALHPEPGVDYLRSLGANSILPRLTGFENEEAYWMATDPKMWDQIMDMQKFVVPPFPTLISTEEENAEINSILTDMDTYRQEMLLKMITGKESLDKFEDYKAQMKKLGVDKLISIKQKQYDRVK